eukprot:29307-Pelagococcus_subviridis.AAC.14
MVRGRTGQVADGAARRRRLAVRGIDARVRRRHWGLASRAVARGRDCRARVEGYGDATFGMIVVRSFRS